MNAQQKMTSEPREVFYSFMNFNRANHKLRVRHFTEKNFKEEDEFTQVWNEVVDFIKTKIVYKVCSCCKARNSKGNVAVENEQSNDDQAKSLPN